MKIPFLNHMQINVSMHARFYPLQNTMYVNITITSNAYGSVLYKECPAAELTAVRVIL